MIIKLKPETERLVQEELQSGHFHSVDELIIQGVHALRERAPQVRTTEEGPRKKTLSEFLLESPLAGSELSLERDRDTGRTIEL